MTLDGLLNQINNKIKHECFILYETLVQEEPPKSIQLSATNAAFWIYKNFVLKDVLCLMFYVDKNIM